MRDSEGQAQLRMEAIGQLTGGIAHDFNNLLTVIIASLDSIHGRLSGDVQLRVGHALQAAESGATLVKQLVAFSRKQALSPAPNDLGAVVEQTAEILRRTLGEHIAIHVHRQGELWTALADAHQVESAIINLAVNARDAMPEGGALRFEVDNAQLDEAYASQHAEVSAGDYVVIAVSDTGIGMAADVLDHAFEPFFTTKEAGGGSGLGLAMVYGFAKQSGGHLKAYSEPGAGTTMRLYLPRYRGAVQGAAQNIATAPERRGAGETILVVEDNAQVRAFATSYLNDLGYKVLEAESGAEAMQVLERAPVDLLFTDIVLAGGLSGRSLARLASIRKSALKVVFTSGYTQRALFDGAALETSEHFLAKPYRGRDLADKLRTVLDRAYGARVDT